MSGKNSNWPESGKEAIITLEDSLEEYWKKKTPVVVEKVFADLRASIFSPDVLQLEKKLDELLKYRITYEDMEMSVYALGCTICKGQIGFIKWLYEQPRWENYILVNKPAEVIHNALIILDWKLNHDAPLA